MNDDQMQMLATMIQRAAAILEERPEALLMAQAMMTGTPEQIQEMIVETKRMRANALRAIRSLGASDAHEARRAILRMNDFITQLEGIAALRRAQMS